MTLYRLNQDGGLRPADQPREHGRHLQPNRRWRSLSPYRQWRAAVMANGDGTCVHCGSDTDLTAGHIKPASTHPELRYAVSNGQVECRSCNARRGTR